MHLVIFNSSREQYRVTVMFKKLIYVLKIANLAKTIVEESADFNQYLTTDDGRWAVKYVDRAETLWEECKQLASESAYEDLDGIEERVKTLASSLEDSIIVWRITFQKP